MLSILIMVAATAGLYMLARSLSPSIDPTQVPPTLEPLQDLTEEVRQGPREHPDPVFLPPSMRSFGDSPFLLRAYYFAKMDADLGPADPNTFFDEITIDVHDPRDGRTWWLTYTVATPSGISQAMKDHSWDYLMGSAMVVVKRYDIPLILRAIAQEMLERWEPDAQAPEP